MNNYGHDEDGDVDDAVGDDDDDDDDDDDNDNDNKDEDDDNDGNIQKRLGTAISSRPQRSVAASHAAGLDPWPRSVGEIPEGMCHWQCIGQEPSIGIVHDCTQTIRILI